MQANLLFGLSLNDNILPQCLVGTIEIPNCVAVLIEEPWRIALFSLNLAIDVSHGALLARLAESPWFPLKGR